MVTKILIIFSFIFYFNASAQQLGYLGLADKKITSFNVNFGFVAVGTESGGIYWKTIADAEPGNDNWQHVELDRKILAVYPHKSGPIGWAISAGVVPDTSDTSLVYCSFMGGEFRPNSAGILNDRTNGVYAMDGFPDPTICGETFAVSNRTLYRRQFTDTVWTPIYTASIEGYIRTIVAKESHPGVLMIGGADGFAGILLEKSTDFGETWSSIAPVATTFDLDFGGENADTIFVSSYRGILRTFDGGVNWDFVFETSAPYFINRIVYDEDNGSVYASGENPVDENLDTYIVFSRDLGETWDRVPMEIKGNVVDMHPSPYGEVWIYFATTNGGVYRFQNILTDVEDEMIGNSPNGYELLNNYPNPFNPSTTIEYTIPESKFSIENTQFVSLKIYDIAGRSVATLVDKNQKPGKYGVSWNAKSMSSGVYYYVLKTPNSKVTKKMLLIK